MGLIIIERLSGRSEFGLVGGATAIALLSLWLIRHARDVRVLRPFLFNRMTLFVGTVSYGIYLYHLLLHHLFVGAALLSLKPKWTGSLAFAAVASLLTLGLATASWVWLIVKGAKAQTVNAAVLIALDPTRSRVVLVQMGAASDQGGPSHAARLLTWFSVQVCGLVAPAPV